MRVSLLNMLSTPLPVLNTLGLKLRVGLSSEDPMVGRYASEAYRAFLSVYSPEGVLLDRLELGEISPHRRKFFDVSTATAGLVPGIDHLAIVHRIPSRLLEEGYVIEDDIDSSQVPDYTLFRSLVEYSFPGGGNGSVIYETPPRLNSTEAGYTSSNTLTFTCQAVLSQSLNTYVIVINHSVSPDNTSIADYSFALHAVSGERVLTDKVTIGPFAIRVLDIGRMVPEAIIDRERDPQDGLSCFTFVGYSDNAALQIVVINAAPSLGAVAVEHTHPPQAYLMPFDASDQRRAKGAAQQAWKGILSARGREE